jgi:exosortase/archaeosortase family protein
MAGAVRMAASAAPSTLRTPSALLKPQVRDRLVPSSRHPGVRPIDGETGVAELSPLAFRASNRRSLLPGQTPRTFVVRFASTAGVLFLLYCFPYAELGLSEGIFNAYIDGYARVVGFILGLFEPGLTVVRNQVHGRFSLEIAKSCDAVECHILLLSALFAVPAPARRKLFAAVVAALALAGLNVVRIVSLYYVGLAWHAAFGIFHAVAWPLAMIAFAAWLFHVSTRWLQRAPNLIHAAPPA